MGDHTTRATHWFQYERQWHDRASLSMLPYIDRVSRLRVTELRMYIIHIINKMIAGLKSETHALIISVTS